MQISDCQGPGVEEKKLIFQVHERRLFWSAGNVPYLDCGDDYILYTFKKIVNTYQLNT